MKIEAAIEGLKRGETWRGRSLGYQFYNPSGSNRIAFIGSHMDAVFIIEDFTATDWERVV